MQGKLISICAATLLILAACKSNDDHYDASGMFEANEVIVSSMSNGRILSFPIEEGAQLAKDSIVGSIDPTGLSLQKQEVEASIQSLHERTSSSEPQIHLLEDQINVQQSQLATLLHERNRTENLVKLDAATGKQLDDINAQIEVLQKQMKVTRQQIDVQSHNTSTQNRGILSEGKPLEKRAAELQDLLDKTNIRNPVSGTVLTKYAEAGELAVTGKALYKIANLSTMTLRAYITGAQLSKVKLSQPVTVLIDSGANKYTKLPGVVTWISDKAEFTPKTIQTKEERANLVYAIKISVNNNGYLKIGMYGEVKL